MSVHPHVALVVPFWPSVTFAIRIRVRGWSLWNFQSWKLMGITLCPLCSFLQRTEIYKASLTRLPRSPGSFLCIGQLKRTPLVWGFLWWRSLRRVTWLDLRIALISSSYLVIWRGRNNKGSLCISKCIFSSCWGKALVPRSASFLESLSEKKAVSYTSGTHTTWS